jgi:hypothetical protein
MSTDEGAGSTLPLEGANISYTEFEADNFPTMSTDEGAGSTLPLEGANISYIEFEADNFPKWRTTKVPSVTEIIKRIVEYQNSWKEQKESIKGKTAKKLHDKCLTEFIYRMNIGEEHGCNTEEDVKSCLNIDPTSDEPLSKDVQETVNLINAYKYFLNEVKKVGDGDDAKTLHGLLTPDMVMEAHKLILKDIKLPANKTKPGEFSNKTRCTEYKGETYVYRSPVGSMGDEVYRILDQYNILIDDRVKKEENPTDSVYNMFKICGWLLFELLDLHPFSDGNGRLCRLLCSYALSSVTPFPTPIYNVWSESKKEDYVNALVEARKYTNRLPLSLTTMIIDCNYHGWQKFFDILERVKTEVKCDLGCLCARCVII